MSKNETRREQLLRAVNLVKPALAAQPYIPALTHVRFNGKTARAYNDVAAIGVRCDLPLDACVPGEMLQRALSSFAGDTVLVQQDGPSVILSSGRAAKVRLPTLAGDAHPLVLPDGDADELRLDADCLKGISMCMATAGSDATRPAAMGVTLDVGPYGLVLYSTDGKTVSRYLTTAGADLPGDAPAVLPAFFCEQLVRLAAAYKSDGVTLELRAGSVTAVINDGAEAWVLSKVLVDLEPLDFAKVFSAHCSDDEMDEAEDEIPPGFDEALGRALLVLSSEVAKTTRVSVESEGARFSMHSESGSATADDRFPFGSVAGIESFNVDPAHVARGARLCQKMAFLPKSLAMRSGDGKFTHLIAHVS